MVQRLRRCLDGVVGGGVLINGGAVDLPEVCGCGGWCNGCAVAWVWWLECLCTTAAPLCCPRGVSVVWGG